MTDDEKAQELALAINALSDVFLEKIPSAIQSMADGLNGLNGLNAVANGSQETAAWELLHRQLHNMASSAGMFGCPELGKRARKLELQINELLKQEANSDQFNLAELIHDYQTFIKWVCQNYVKR